MLRLALTGSIGMGKSTTAAMFAEAGVPLWDADEAVHRLYGPGAAGAEAVARLAPQAVGPEGVDRATLRAATLEDPELLPRIEAAVHPLVAADREAFLDRAEADGAEMALCDIPLLFESGGEAGFDRVIVVSAPDSVQRARVLARPGMSEAAFARIAARQLPDEDKRARADHVIETGDGMEAARAQVRALLSTLRKEAAHA